MTGRHLNIFRAVGLRLFLFLQLSFDRFKKVSLLHYVVNLSKYYWESRRLMRDSGNKGLIPNSADVHASFNPSMP